MLEVAFNPGAAGLIPDYLRQFQPNHPVGYLDNNAAMAYLQVPIMMPGYVPKMVFIDRAGMIRFQYTGEDAYFQDQGKNIRATLEEMLKAQSAKKTGAVKKKS